MGGEERGCPAEPEELICSEKVNFILVLYALSSFASVSYFSSKFSHTSPLRLLSGPSPCRASALHLPQFYAVNVSPLPLPPLSPPSLIITILKLSHWPGVCVHVRKRARDRTLCCA